jgi:hypothetical protein
MGTQVGRSTVVLSTPTPPGRYPIYIYGRFVQVADCADLTPVPVSQQHEVTWETQSAILVVS